MKIWERWISRLLNSQFDELAIDRFVSKTMLQWRIVSVRVVLAIAQILACQFALFPTSAVAQTGDAAPDTQNGSANVLPPPQPQIPVQPDSASPNPSVAPFRPQFIQPQSFTFPLTPEPAPPSVIIPTPEPEPPLPGNSVPLLPTEVKQLPLRLEIKLSQRQVTLYAGDKALKKYSIAIGRPGWETPLGQYQVKQMFRNPTWVHPLKQGITIPGGDPENPLGRYWIGFWTDGKNWIGFHGTDNQASVGKPVSHGCIRMYNKDIEEMFQKVNLGTEVRVVK